jgi:putative transposase
MPRKRREYYPGVMLHVTARGNRKQEIFREKEDYLYYLSLIKRAQEKTPFYLHSYCLMTNHVHLLIETIEHSPSDIILFIHSIYARYFNRKYELVGHVFQERYHATLIKSWRQMLDTSRYIHLNPVKANMTNKPEEYPWSSYRAYISKTSKDTIVHTKRLLSEMTNGSKETYKFYVELNIKEGSDDSRS